jgi:hypothetical protein
MSAQETDELKVLREILKWMKFAGMNQVQSVLEITLNTPEKKLAYQMSDGTKGTIEVGKVSKVGSPTKVSTLWREWKRKGLGDSLSVQGGDRFKRTFDLEDFGIEVPQIVTSPATAQLQPASTPVPNPVPSGGSPNA